MAHNGTPESDTVVHCKLRLLQTTDLHMHLLPFDYAAMRPSNDIGLARLIPLIERFQADDIPTLLFDTGDFLQGNPLADRVASQTGPHPLAKVFNALGYDAIAVGNHDFDYGAEALDNLIQNVDAPVLCANLDVATAQPAFRKSTILDVSVSPDTHIKIGVMGLCTPVIALLDTQGRNLLSAQSPLDVARKEAAALKNQGADIVVALCHFGIDLKDNIENVASQIAKLSDIDVIMAGHTHETFPQGSPHRDPAIDVTTGTIHNTPTVMAGAFGRHLGKITLDICKDLSGTTITAVDASIMTPTATAQQLPAILDHITPPHTAAINSMTAIVGQTTKPLSTAFSLIEPDLTQYLLAQARESYIASNIVGKADAKLPLLSAAAPFRTGSRADPFDYIHLPAGAISHADIVAIYPFHNVPVALRRNGRQIRDWLEDSALIFQQITAGTTLQSLINPHIPPYRFDTIFGLAYQIDPSNEPGKRIVGLCYQGQSITDNDMFLLVTTSNRLNHRQNIPDADIVFFGQQSSQDILRDYIRAQSPVTAACPSVWSFAPLKDTAAQIYTSPVAKAAETTRNVRDNGITQAGFRQFTLDLGG